jgi:hypothetical protein
MKSLALKERGKKKKILEGRERRQEEITIKLINFLQYPHTFF